MNDFELPPELRAVEERLAARPRVEPSAGLGLRVRLASRAALRSPAATWRTWGAIAAALLLGVNLSMSVAANTDWRLTPAVESGQVAATAERLRALAPELPESEIRRQALLLRAGSTLAPAVPLPRHLHTVHPSREEHD